MNIISEKLPSKLICWELRDKDALHGDTWCPNVPCILLQFQFED